MIFLNLYFLIKYLFTDMWKNRECHYPKFNKKKEKTNSHSRIKLVTKHFFVTINLQTIIFWLIYDYLAESASEC